MVMMAQNSQVEISRAPSTLQMQTVSLRTSFPPTLSTMKGIAISLAPFSIEKRMANTVGLEDLEVLDRLCLMVMMISFRRGKAQGFA